MKKEFLEKSYKYDGYSISVKSNENVASIKANKHAIKIYLTSNNHK